MTAASLPIEALLRPHRPADQGHFVASFRAPGGIAFEEERHEAFRDKSQAGSELYFWTQSRCLVTSPALARRPEFASADERSSWPVVVRRSGGGTVFHGPGVLCVTLFERLPAANIERAYAGICSLIANGLQGFGLEPEVGPLRSAPCDGRFNILLGGRKLAGTAARIIPGRNGISLMAHASLLVEGGCRAGVEAIAGFENALGLDTSYPPDCMITLADHIGGIDVASAAEAIRKAYRPITTS